MRALRRPRLLGCIVAGAVSVVATGCASIPTDSPVREGREVGAQDEPQLNSNLPSGPVAGASREEIVAGFFEAMLAYPRSDELARSFLSPAAADRWDPSRTLVVYDDQRLIERETAVNFESRRLGSLDEHGSWTSSTAGTSGITLPLRTEVIDGEWRLANPPSGTYIDRDYFVRYFDPFSLYYFDPTGTILTPDPVYLLLDDATATHLVENLLRGPSGQLLGVASTAAAPGLAVTDPVDVTINGLAEIPLNAVAASMSPDERRLLAAQLSWTLRALPDVETLAITVGGQRLNIEGSGTEFGVDDFTGYDPAGFAASRQLFGWSQRGLVTVSQDGASGVVGAIADAVRSPRDFAVDPSGTRAAVVKTGGDDVVVGLVSEVGGGVSTWFSNARDLLRPSWDIHQILWLVDQTRNGARLSIATANKIQTVRASGITGEKVLSFAISRDGTRIAAITKTDRRTRLSIAIIDRVGGDPFDVQLSVARTVFGPNVTFSGRNHLAWLSPTSVAVLANEDGGNLQPFDVSIDGSSITTFDGFLPIRPLSIASGPNIDIPVVVGNRKGVLYARGPESGWARYAGTAKVLSPVYPG